MKDKILKSFEVEEKAEGIFTGYASTYNNVDRDGDIILPGTFTKTLAKKNKLPLLYNHDHNQPVGVVELSSNSHGLFAKGKLNMNDPEARRLHDLIQMGGLSHMSISFGPQEWLPEKNAHGGYTITKAELYEVSLVTVPANPEAIILSAKSAKDKKIMKKVNRLLEGVNAMPKFKIPFSLFGSGATKTPQLKKAEMKRAVEALQTKSITVPENMEWGTYESRAFFNAFDDSATIYNTFRHLEGVTRFTGVGVSVLVGGNDLAQYFKEGIKLDSALTLDALALPECDWFAAYTVIPKDLLMEAPQLESEYLMELWPRTLLAKLEAEIFVDSGEGFVNIDSLDQAPADVVFPVTGTDNYLNDLLEAVSLVQGVGPLYAIVGKDYFKKLQQDNPTLEDVAMKIGVEKIFPVDWLNGIGKAFVYRHGAITIIGDTSGTEIMRDFILRGNLMEYLAEIYVAGGLTNKGMAAMITYEDS